MSKKRVEKDSEASQVVVGGDKHGRGSTRKWLIGTFLLLVVVLIATVSWLTYQHYKSVHDKQKAAELVIQKQSVQATQDSAGVKAFSGDTNGAINDLEKKLSYTTNKADRANIYNQIALIYAGEKQIDKAVAASEQATQEDPSYVRYATTALIYENAGDKAKAAEFYQKAVDAYNPNDKLNQSLYPKGINPDIEQYKMKIKELEGE